MNALPYVYKLTDRTTGEFYIGYRCANKVPAVLDLGVKYFSSSVCVKTRGFDNFTSQIVSELPDKESAIELESKLIDESWGNPLLLNKHNRGSRFKNTSPRPEWLKEKLSLLNKGKRLNPFTQEHKDKIGSSNRGRTIENGRKPLSVETRKKMSDSKKGKSGSARFEKLECPHCLKLIDAGNFARYHGNNCKAQSCQK